MHYTTKNALIAGGTAVIVALIGYLAIRPSADAKPVPTIIQKTDSGNNNNAGRDNNQAGHDNYIAGKDLAVNNFYLDTSNTKKKKNAQSGNTTITVTSNNQRGGFTVGQLNVFTKVEMIIAPSNADTMGLSKNYSIRIDTTNQLISVQPKVGAWTEPFIGIPGKEQESVAPHFGSKDREIKSMVSGSFYSKNDTVYAMASKGTPSTKDFYYTMHYVKMPSYVVFGDHQGPLYKAFLR